MPLADALRALTSREPEVVSDAALKLGLLLEQSRFRLRGSGTLGDSAATLGDLFGVDLSEETAREVVLALVASVESHGRDANPLVVWAIGKAHDPDHLEPLRRLADLLIADPEPGNLLHQLVHVLATVAPDQSRPILERAAREAVGDTQEIARNAIEMRGWE